MGQYYKPVIKNEVSNKVLYTDRKLEGEGYVNAKLLEHGYTATYLCQSIAKLLEDSMCRLAWVGDYAEDDEVSKITNGEVSYELTWGDEDNRKFGENDENHPLKTVKRFGYKGKYLINHTKKVAISFDNYIKKSKNKLGWIIAPFVALTAIGNGRGGGDYGGVNEDKVGSWAWDEITIDKIVPEDYTIDDEIYFKEEW